MLNKKELVKNQIFRGSFIVLTANIIASFGTYLFHLITGRLLNLSQYGLLQSLIALSYFTGVFVNSFSFVVINRTAGLKGNQLKKEIFDLEKISLKLSLGFWLVFLLLFPLIKKLLHLQSFTPYFVFMIPVLFIFPYAHYLSLLRSQLKFISFSLLGILISFSKTILAWLFIFLGWQLMGALQANNLSIILSTLLGWILIKKYWPRTIKIKASFSEKIEKQANLFQFSILSLMTNLFLTSLYSTDVVLTRFFFSSDAAGLYAAVSVLGKIIFFAATSILLVAYPLFVKYKNNLAKLKLSFRLSVLFISFISLGGILVYKFFPQFIVKLLYGQKYLGASSYLFSFSVFIILYAFLNLFIQFLLALEKKQAAYITALTALSQSALIVFNHQNLKSIINNSIISLSFGLLLSVFFVKNALNEIRKE
ncbi:hypothetical protein COT75_05060 [Candidatus Beckwithbacteria bacterium CG10_big_fil_rev_8_21_14_0_10_34_10]|uniref:Polysaccharide biosynthesis protein C-terminal domain-containing protein n=1 Tax=Candidatus Beckwithbacteria bacterium CG10_big_fil_rev_8_21_14_0_10_34_10 TaxID=1974495 RepID=A0A2H0WA81_9BACT|nr:MAG: hypothetical protein COT75_05060 [Candidatus Beckwithbacteria bacterium CG10_big_fil_rev_8_21_14_0_10_34_10]